MTDNPHEDPKKWVETVDILSSDHKKAFLSIFDEKNEDRKVSELRTELMQKLCAHGFARVIWIPGDPTFLDFTPHQITCICGTVWDIQVKGEKEGEEHDEEECQDIMCGVC